MLLNILIDGPIHNVAEPILLTVLERQPKQQVGLFTILPTLAEEVEEG